MKNYEKINFLSNCDSNVVNIAKTFEVEMYLDRAVETKEKACVIFSDFIILCLSILVIRLEKTFSVANS